MSLQGQSSMTPLKQQDYSEFLDWWFGLVKKVQTGKNANAHRKTVVYIDAYAGSGYNYEVNVVGSPVLFCQKAEQYQVLYQAHLIEKDKERASNLHKLTNLYNAKIYNDDNKNVLPGLIQNLPSSSLGLIYFDPNGLDMWPMVKLVTNHPKTQTIDVLIRYSASAGIRNHHYGYHLKDDILNINKGYLYGKELYQFDKQRWSFLLGMNFQFRDWKSKGWYALDSDKGKDLKEKLTFSKEELKKKRQPHLTGLMENTYSIPLLELSEHKPLNVVRAFVNFARKIK